MPQKIETTASDHQPSHGNTPTPASMRERRRFKRLTTVINGKLFFAAERAEGVVLDVSVNGVKFKTDIDMPLGAPVTLSLAGSVHFGGEIAWRHGKVLGVRFSKAPERVAEVLSAMMPPEYLQYGTA